MNLGVFDNIDGLYLREQGNCCPVMMGMSDERKKASESTSEFPGYTPLAMAYVPFQTWGDVTSAEDALCTGTLFKDLNFPFMEGGSVR